MCVDTSFVKQVDLAITQSSVNKSDIDTLRTVPTNLNNWESEVDIRDVGQLKSVPIDLK